MLSCGEWVDTKIYKLLYIDQPIAKAKTAVVVKKRPTAAVAVNNERFILNLFCKS